MDSFSPDKFLFPIILILMQQSEGVFGTQPNIYDGAFCENSWRLKTINYFCKNSPSYMLDWALYTSQLPVKIQRFVKNR